MQKWQGQAHSCEVGKRSRDNNPKSLVGACTWSHCSSVLFKTLAFPVYEMTLEGD